MRFEIVMDIGSYRDLHRHRMMTQERQTFSTHHGFATPAEALEAALAVPFKQPSNALRNSFESWNRWIATLRNMSFRWRAE